MLRPGLVPEFAGLVLAELGYSQETARHTLGRAGPHAREQGTRTGCGDTPCVLMEERSRLRCGDDARDLQEETRPIEGVGTPSA